MIGVADHPVYVIGFNKAEDYHSKLDANSLVTTSLMSVSITIGADSSDDPVVFNIKMSSAAILLKP